MVEYAFIGVEGNHDQAFIGKILKLFLQLQDFREPKAGGGLIEHLDPFWSKLIPSYPTKKGELYKRLPMPSILYNEELSVAIYDGGGKSLSKNLNLLLENDSIDKDKLSSFIIIADADNKPINSVVKHYHQCFQNYFPNFPNQAGKINHGKLTSTGIYVLPNNTSQGTLDQLLCQCGEVTYSEFMGRGKVYLNNFTEDERKQLKWKQFSYEKALIATIVSVLKPGMTNTVSISQNNWISEQTKEEVNDLKQLVEFLANVLK